jgi:hypothetical protein
VAIEDAVTPADAVEMNDMLDRVVTERYLLDQEPWPRVMRLPLKRMETLECGYVQRDHYGRPEPIVYVPGSRVGCRCYSNIGQLIDAGWRVD